MRVNRSGAIALAGAAAVLVGGGTAVAASEDGAHAVRCEARLARIAERRGVSLDQLEANLRARLTARVDAALQAGRISPERAALLRGRISEGELCKSPTARKARLAGRGVLRAAAAYLGLDARQLRAQLAGTSLAALAQEQGKSVDGLQAAMLAPAKQRLDAAVESGRVSRARADRALERLERLVERLAAKVFPAK